MSDVSASGAATGALGSAQPRTRLVTDPSDRPKLTSYRETDARTALTRGLGEYLLDRQIDLPGGRQLKLRNVYDQWPEQEQDAQLPALSVSASGTGLYGAKSMTPTIIPADRLAEPDGRWFLCWAELEQDVVAELHATDPAEREGLMALIEDAFCPEHWASGFRLALPHYFGQHAHYLPLSVGYPDTAEAAGQRQRIVQFTVRAEVGVLVLKGYPTFKSQAPLSVTQGSP